MNIFQNHINANYHRMVDEVKDLARFEGNDKAVATLDAIIDCLTAQRAELKQL
tara:strand:+ start:112 stop:270 length:159 start_codon:yes stop_codon:yes gene_type:complete